LLLIGIEILRSRVLRCYHRSSVKQIRNPISFPFVDHVVLRSFNSISIFWSRTSVETNVHNVPPVSLGKIYRLPGFRLVDSLPNWLPRHENKILEVVDSLCHNTATKRYDILRPSMFAVRPSQLPHRATVSIVFFGTQTFRGRDFGSHVRFTFYFLLWNYAGSRECRHSFYAVRTDACQFPKPA
jgi:hypothetical protein